MYKVLLVFKDENISEKIKRMNIWGENSEFEISAVVKDGTTAYDEVKKQLQAMGLAIETSVKINTAAFIDVLPLTLYAQVITIIYECYCEFYEPAKADQVYARAKMEIKNKYPDVDLHQLL